MKIVILGGSGLIGTKLASRLRAKSHDVLQPLPSTGVHSITDEGFERALAGRDIVVDVADAPPSEDHANLAFFEESCRSLLAAEAAAGVRHHVTLSVVGADRLPDCSYFRAKLAQEHLIRRSAIPYTILRATPVFESIGGIVDRSSDEKFARLSPALFQPVASDDVAATLADVAFADPVNGIIEIAGPERLSLDEFGRKYLGAINDPRKAIADIHARYCGADLDDRSLTPGDKARLGVIRFEDWLASLRK